MQPVPSNQWCPSLLWRFLQDLKQQVAEGFGDGTVARWRQVEVVEHVLWANASVRVDKLFAHVQELSLAQSGQPGAQELVHSGVLLPQRVGPLASWQQTLRVIKVCSKKPTCWRTFTRSLLQITYPATILLFDHRINNQFRLTKRSLSDVTLGSVRTLHVFTELSLKQCSVKLPESV